MENVAPWQPEEDAVLMEAAPGRSIAAALLPAMLSLRPVWPVKVTPVAVQPGWPLSAVIVPLPTTLTKVTAKLLGLVTFRVTSPERPPAAAGGRPSGRYRDGLHGPDAGRAGAAP